MESDRRIAQATKWSVATELAVKLVSPVTNMILARVLAPEVFGVVATLTMVVSLAEVFTDAGFQKFLVQHKFQDENELEMCTNVAFWTNLALSLILWAGIACFAKPIAVFVGSPEKEAAIIVMSAEIPVLAFSSIQMARYRKVLNFKQLFAAKIITAFVPLVVTIPLALVLHSYWALVAGILTRDVLNAIVLSARSSWRPSFAYSFSKLKSMLNFAIWTIGENISVWLAGYIDIFIVGIALTEHYLGLYKTTMNTINSILGIVTASTLPVLFSSLSLYQHDDKQFVDIFLKFQRNAALLVFPLGFGVFAYRELAVLICLGRSWIEVSDFFGLWALVSAFVIVLSHYDSEVFRGKGRPQLSVLAQCMHMVCMIPALLWGRNNGFEALWLARTLSRLPGILVSAAILQCAIGIRFASVLKNIWPPFVSAAVMALAGMLLRTLFDSILWELFTVLLCVLIYAGVMLLLPAGRRQLAEIPILSKLLPLGNKITDEGDEERC